VATLVTALVAAACSDDDLSQYDGLGPESEPVASTSPSTGDEPSEDEATSGVDSRPGQLDDLDAAYLFDQSRLHTFELALTDDDLAFLDGDPTAEEYVDGTLTFEGVTIPVGIRYKGSVGAFVGCVDGPELFDPSGAKTCPKLSMKVKINWENPDDEFLGVRKLQFHSMNLDPSQMRERLGYWLMREMGVAAPRSTHARLVVNGEFVGLFALTENIDGRFTRANFDDGTGNLYKEVWPFTEDGRVTDERVFIEGLRTNERDPNTNALITRRFATELLDAADPTEVVREWMDVDALMNQLAVDRTIRHDDGPFHWYCDVERGGCGNHNFFFYENPSTGQITMVPWDLDNAFANIVEADNPVTPIPDGLGDISADCAPFPYEAFGLVQRSASCDPLFAAWAALDEEYAAAVRRLHDGPLRAEVLDPLLDEWAAQIEDATREAFETHGTDALTVPIWRWALEDLRKSLDHARENPVG